MGSLLSSLLLSALLAPKLFCPPKPRSSKYEVPGHWGMQWEGRWCVTSRGVLTAVGGTVLWRSGNLGSVRPPERLGFSAEITQTCGPALKNTLAPASRNVYLPQLVKVSQNISALQCYTRREPDSERDAFKTGLESTAGSPPRSKNKTSGVCEHRHHSLPPPSSTAPPALQLLWCLQELQQKRDTTKSNLK